MKNLKNYTHSQLHSAERVQDITIELIKHEAGYKDKYYTNTNEIIFILSGRIDISFNNSRQVIDGTEKMFFIHSDIFFAFESVTDIEVVIIRFKSNIDLCKFISINEVKEYAELNSADIDSDISLNFTYLQIHERIYNVLENIKLYIEEGINYQEYLDLKIHEFFILMNMYYEKKDIYNFLRMIINDDAPFIDFIINNWMKYNSISEIAEYLDMSTRQFSTTFKKAFGITAYKWIKTEKSKLIHKQLVTSNTPIKEIAFEYGFGSLPQFTKYCKTEMGFTPTEIREKNISICKL